MMMPIIIIIIIIVDTALECSKPAIDAKFAQQTHSGL